MKWRQSINLITTLMAVGVFVLTVALPSFGGETRIITDELGRKVEIPKPVTRAAVFNIYNAEYFRAVGGAEVLAGIDEGALKVRGYWEAVVNKEPIGSGQNGPNYEQLALLKPDVVVFPRNGQWQDAEKKLKPFNIPVVVITGWDVDKSVENVALIGEMLEKKERAAELNQFYTDHMRLVEERLKGVEPVKLYYETMEPFFTPLKGSGHHMMLVQAGGENIFEGIEIAGQPKSKGDVHKFEVSPEQVLVKLPEVVIRSFPRSYSAPPSGKMKGIYEEMLSRPGWSDLPAVRNKRVYVASRFPLGACAKMVGVVYFAKRLHPDLFEDLDHEKIMERWLVDFQGVSNVSGYYYPND